VLFKMEVELGNEAMQSGLDVAHALVRTAGRIDRAVGRDPLASGEQGVVMDANGNTVGSWEVVADA
jgi:hypothetical protein